MKQKEDIKQIVLALAKAADAKKGEDIRILDLEGVSTLTDYFLLITASNVKLAQAISDEVEDVAAQEGMTVINREGYREGSWILLDFGDCMCHVFSGESREFYGLEELWSDAAQVEFEGV